MTVLQRHPVDRPSISQRFAEVSDRGSHLGVDYRPDFPGQTNFPVFAAHDGFVVFARSTPHEVGNPWEQIPNNGNSGKSVILQAIAPHQASATSYNHLGTIAVKEGQFVKAGTFLGYMGWTGFVLPASPAGTHLHFELFIDYGNGQYPAGTSYGRVNPLEYFAVKTTVPVAPGPGGTSGTKPKEPAVAEAPNPWAYRNTDAPNLATGGKETRDAYQILRQAEANSLKALQIAKANAAKIDTILAIVKVAP